MTGYAFTGTTATTYQGTSSVSCATGYDGTASPTSITCEASGIWTSVSGCTIKGINNLLYLTAYKNHLLFVNVRFMFTSTTKEILT